MASRGVVRLVGAGLVLRRAALLEAGWTERFGLVDRQGGALTSGGDHEIVLRVRRAGYDAWYNPAMRLHHFIPEKRMSADYLCRLHRGFGKGAVQLHFIETETEPSLSQRLRALLYSFRALAGVTADLLAPAELIQGQLAVERRVAFHEALGRIEGAWQFLVEGARIH
jgi:hypothetical protein